MGGGRGRGKTKQMENNVPKVSIIIPVYKSENYLRKCLDSVCNQTLKDIEIICINDCSPDDCLEILKEYASKDDRFKIIDFKENKGAACARNAGIDAAQGEYLGFVDSDDFIDLDFYEKLYNKALETGADITKSNLLFENSLQEKAKPKYHNLQEVKENKLYLNHIPTTIIKKTLINNYKITFPEDLTNAEDCVFEVITATYANQIAIMETTYYHYNFNTYSLNNSQQYTLSKILNLVRALIMITKFLNNLDISQRIYQKFITHKYNVVIDTVFQKCNENLEELKNFENLILQFKSQLKYPLLGNSWAKITILKETSGIKPYYKGTIPKRIFYVWGNNESKPEKVLKCMESWKKNLPDYEIIEINDESNEYFDFQEELKQNKWFKTVYERKMWAYVADYIRIKVLHNNGGIYLDTDVEVLKSFDDVISAPAFIGIQDSSLDGNKDLVEPAILGAQKGNILLKKILLFYDNLIWEEPIYTMPEIFSYFLNRYNIYPFPQKSKQKIIKLKDINIYPEEFFIPFRFKTEYEQNCITPNTHTIHWWGGSWLKPEILSFLNKKHIISTLRKRVVTCH